MVTLAYNDPGSPMDSVRGLSDYGSDYDPEDYGAPLEQWDANNEELRPAIIIDGTGSDGDIDGLLELTISR